jgi:hypothetical protein
VRSEEARIGGRVRVRLGYRKSELWGALGTIAKVWGGEGAMYYIIGILVIILLVVLILQFV